MRILHPSQQNLNLTEGVNCSTFQFGNTGYEPIKLRKTFGIKEFLKMDSFQERQLAFAPRHLSTMNM